MFKNFLVTFFFIALFSSNLAFATWGNWKNIGGLIQGAPSFVKGKTADGQDLFMVGVRGMDNALWINQKIGKTGEWSGFYSVGGLITSQPTCSVLEAGIVNCFVLDVNSKLVYKPYYNGQWLDWQSTNYELTINSPVSVYSPDSDNITVVATGTLPGSTTPGMYELKWRRYEKGWCPVVHPNGCPESWRPTGWYFHWEPVKQPAFPADQNVSSRVICDGFFHRVPKDGSAYGLGWRELPMGACIAPWFGGQSAFTISEYNGHYIQDSKPATSYLVLEGIYAAYPPAMTMGRYSDTGMVTFVFYTHHNDKSLRFRQHYYAQGWREFKPGVKEKNFGGVLTSSPSCFLTGCAARGQDGAVWVTGTFED